MDQLDHTGKTCPSPVIDTKKYLDAAAPGTAVEVIVDNQTAVDNMSKFAEQRGYSLEQGESSPGRFHLVLTSKDVGMCEVPPETPRAKNRVVAIGSSAMGIGDDRLGAALMKGFIYALTETDDRPTTILFYNGGAKLTVEGSEALPDLQRLEEAGVQILTCGTCLNHYELGDQLAVGGVTNMYTIVEILMGADSVVKP